MKLYQLLNIFQLSQFATVPKIKTWHHCFVIPSYAKQTKPRLNWTSKYKYVHKPVGLIA